MDLCCHRAHKSKLQWLHLHAQQPLLFSIAMSESVSVNNRLKQVISLHNKSFSKHFFQFHHFAQNHRIME